MDNFLLLFYKILLTTKYLVQHQGYSNHFLNTRMVREEVHVMLISIQTPVKI